MANEHIYWDRTKPRGDWLGLPASAEGLYWIMRQRLCRIRGPLPGALVAGGVPMTVKDIAREVHRSPAPVGRDLDNLVGRGLVAIDKKGFFRVVGFNADQDRIGRSRSSRFDEPQRVTGQNPVQNSGETVGDSPVDNSDLMWISPGPCGKPDGAEFNAFSENDRFDEGPIPTSQRVTGQNPVKNSGKMPEHEIDGLSTHRDLSRFDEPQRVTGENPVKNNGKSAGKPGDSISYVSRQSNRIPARPSGVPPSPNPGHPPVDHPTESHRSPDPIDHPIPSRPTEESGGTPEGRAGKPDTQADLVTDIVAFVKSDQYEPAFGARVATLDGFPGGLRIARSQFDRVKAECAGPKDKRPANPGSRVMSYFNKEITRQTILTGGRT